MPTRYSKEEILDIRNSLAVYAYMPVAARRAIDQLLADLEKAHACIEHAVRIYGKYGCIINEPGNAGVWRAEAGEILNKNNNNIDDNDIYYIIKRAGKTYTIRESIFNRYAEILNINRLT